MLSNSLLELVEASQDALELLEDEGIGEFVQARLRVALVPVKKLLGNEEESEVYVQEQETVVYLYDKTSLKLYNKAGNS